jgi:hypothetical protein
MKKLLLATAMLAALTGNAAYAYDAAFETALATFYDKNCAKLPADFLNAKIKEVAPPKTKEARDWWQIQMKDAQDGVQSDYERNPKEFCELQARNIKCMLSYYRTKKGGSC